MQIDRARFLLLTASLAGTGCSANPQPSGNVGPEPAPSGTELVVPETTAGDTTTEEPAETTTSVATTEPQTPPQTPTGACDNDTATIPACSLVSPGPACESFADTKVACKGYKNTLRGAIAAKAVACLNAASGTPDICDYSKVETCTSAAIRAACVQPSTFNACSPVVAQCSASSWSKLTMNDCQSLLSAVKDGKRTSMITCMTEGCSLESCTWMLR